MRQGAEEEPARARTWFALASGGWQHLGMAHRILLMTFGTRGDVDPYIALGVSLRERGMEVTVATGQGFEEAIFAAGLQPFSFSIDYKKMLQTPELQAALTTVRGKLAAARMMRAETNRQYAEIAELITSEPFDLIVTSPKAFAATVMARAVGTICVSSTLQPSYVPRSDFPHFLFSGNYGSWLNVLSYRAFNWLTLWGQNLSFGKWARQHLPRDWDLRLRDFRGFHPRGKPLPILQAFSSALVPPAAEWDPQLEPITGYWFSDEAGQELSPELEDFLASGPPPLYVGFGSMPAREAGKVAELARATAQRLNLRLVLARGWAELDLGELLETEFVVGAAPHSLLFPRCAALVHHGGAGTTHVGLRSGRPTVICPAGVDQPFWGRRLVALGLALPALPLAQMSSELLAERLRYVLQPTQREGFSELGKRIAAQKGKEQAAEILCDLLRD